jgi:hypothetical protein
LTERHEYRNDAVNLEVPTMSRKDFVAIADAIRQNVKDAATRQAVAQALLPALRASNPNFKPDKFIDAAVGE